MAVISVEVIINEGRSEYVSILTVKSYDKDNLVILVASGSNMYSIYKDKVTEEWRSDVNVKNRRYVDYIKAIGLAVDNRYSFNY